MKLQSAKDAVEDDRPRSDMPGEMKVGPKKSVAPVSAIA